MMRSAESLIHRLAPGPKLLALILLIAVISIDLPFIDDSVKPWIPAFGLLLTAGLYAVAFSGAGKFLEQVWAFKLLIVLVTIPQLLFG